MSQPQQQHVPTMVFVTASSGVSSDAQYYHTVYYKLPRPLIAPDGYQWAVSLRSLSIVNSQLVVCAYTSGFTVNGVGYTLAEGNYDANGLAAALTAQTVAVGVVWWYDATTLKMWVRGSASVTVGGPLCVDVLDMAEGSSGVSVCSARTVRLTGVQSILVDTPDLQGTNVTLRARGSSASTLARVMVDAAPLATVHYSSTDAGNLLFDSAVSGFTLALTDENGQPLLCTVPYQATLQFAPVYTGRTALAVPRPLALNLPPTVTGGVK